MYLGRLVEVQETEALFEAPLHPYTRLLIDAVPSLEDIGRDRTPVQGEVPSPSIHPPAAPSIHAVPWL